MSAADPRPGRRPRSRATHNAVAASLALVTALFVAMALPGTASAQASGGETQVTVVHGLRGELVDVYLDGKLLLEGFQPDRLTEPMTVPAGVHRVDLRPAGTPATDPPKATASPDLPPGPVAVVAHFAPDGAWTMSVYTDGAAQLAAGSGRVVFRNTAAVSPIDVSVDDADGGSGIVAGAESERDLPAGSYAVAVTDQSGRPVIPDSDVDVRPGSAVALYLVGTGDSATWLVQELDASAQGPRGVAAGNSGLAAGSSAGFPLGGAALIVVGVALVIGASLGLRRRSPATT